MDAHRKPRLGQFSLRSFLILLTLASVCCGAVAWRRMRDARAAAFVQQFNAAIDALELDAAENITQDMEREFPAHPVVEMMAWKAAFARMVLTEDRSTYEERNEKRYGVVCGTFSCPGK